MRKREKEERGKCEEGPEIVNKGETKDQTN
jgi:hypothetical protein